MATRERSISDVLHDIAGDIQDIVRSEVRLAKSEIVAETDKAKGAAPFLIIGVVCILLAALFLVWTVVYALALVLPTWAASLIVAAVLASAGGIILTAGVKKLREVSSPTQTIASIKENVQWAKQPIK
ncbi:MAG: phage holin family protein [Acidobacteriaceae bacterium]